jgi:hypothetical protein
MRTLLLRRGLALILLHTSFVASTKVRVRKEGQRKDEKPIRLNDLIPSKDVAGGGRTVFGSSQVVTPPEKRKPKK